MTNNQFIAKRSPRLIFMDIVSAFFALVLLTCLWWMWLQPIKVSFSTFELQLLICFADMAPGIVGMIWLEYNYRYFLREKFPVYYRWHLRGLILFIGIFVPYVLLFENAKHLP